MAGKATGRAAGRRAARQRGGSVAKRSRHASATSHDVAELAGVSRSAVSRTFTPGASVSERTRRKVLDAAARLGYQPDAIARSLITRRSRLVGLIMGEWENPFYTTMLRGFSEKLQARDYQVMLLTQWPDGSVDAAVRLLMRYRVDGIVLVSCEPSADTAHDCERAGVRLLLVNREAPQLPATSVVADNARVGHAVAEMFLRAGYERFALVCGDGAAPSIRQRVKSFRAAIAAAKRGRVVIDKRGVLGYQAGRRWVREAMRREPRPDAVFCSSDLTALGVLDGARLDLGIAVPDSLAVVGFGDSPMAAFAAYDLTTAHLPVDSLIDASIESLFAEAPPGPRSPIVIETALVQRATVRKVPSPPRR